MDFTNHYELGSKKIKQWWGRFDVENIKSNIVPESILITFLTLDMYYKGITKYNYH